MAGRSAAQLIDIRLVEEKRIDDSLFQDYARIHERLERSLESAPRPIDEETAQKVRDQLLASLAGQAAKAVPHERLSQFLRCGLGHICAELCAVPGLPLEEVARRAYEELGRRGWDAAEFELGAAQAALVRVEEAAKVSRLSSTTKKKNAPSARSVGTKKKVSEGIPNVASAKTEKAAQAKKEAPMMSEKKAAPARKPVPKAAAAKKTAVSAAKTATKKAAVAKKPAAKKLAEKRTPTRKPTAKAVARKPAVRKAVRAASSAAKKPAAKKAVAKKLSARKPAAKKLAEKKPAVRKTAAKKPAAKKAVAKKAVAKAPAAKKPAVKKVAASKPAAKKPAAPKPAIEPRPLGVPPIEEKKQDPTL